MINTCSNVELLLVLIFINRRHDDKIKNINHDLFYEVSCKLKKKK